MATKPTNPKTPKPAGGPRGAKAGMAKPKLVKDKPVTEGAEKAAAGMRLKDLVDKVAAGSEVKKKDVRTVIEATLIQMATALKAGESLNLAGLGRLRVARAGTEGGAMTLKLRMGGPAEKGEKPGAEPLADAEDQD